MICIKCGKEVNDTDKFCENCGHDLTKKTFIELFIKYKKHVVLVFIVITVLLAGFLGYQYYDSHKKLVNPFKKYFARVGVQFTKKDNGIIITDFVKDSPADKSDLEKNDIILKVNHKNLNGLNTDEISKLIQGQANKKVILQVKRKDKIHNITVVRENIGDYYYNFETGKNIYTKYLKYDNGKYSFWVVELPKEKINFGVKNCTYVKYLEIVDLKNQKIGLLETIYYDKNDNVIKTDDYTKNGELKLDSIFPNSIGYLDYKMIKRIDDNSSEKEKEQFKGFLE